MASEPLTQENARCVFFILPWPKLSWRLEYVICIRSWPIHGQWSSSIYWWFPHGADNAHVLLYIFVWIYIGFLLPGTASCATVTCVGYATGAMGCTCQTTMLQTGMSGPMLITKCWCYSESFESTQETHHHWWTSLCAHLYRPYYFQEPHLNSFSGA